MQQMYDNEIFNVTLTASTENVDHPLTNLEDKKLSKTFRTLSNTDQTILFAGPLTASRLLIAGHNLSVDAMVRIQGNNTDSWGSPSLDQLIPYKSGIMLAKFDEVTYNYFRLFIDDSESNSNEYIEIGGLFIGTFLQWPNMAINQKLSKITTSKSNVSPSGGLSGDKRYNYRTTEINFPSITDAQKAEIETMFDYTHNTEPFYIVPWANREDIEAPRYGFWEQNSFSFPRSDNWQVPWSTKTKFREVF